MSENRVGGICFVLVWDLCFVVLRSMLLCVVGSMLLCGGIYPSVWYGIYMNNHVHRALLENA